jgi:capsule polysaccharide export protein KpsE/RkpR
LPFHAARKQQDEGGENEGRGIGVKENATAADPQLLERGPRYEETSERREAVAERQAQILRLLWDRRKLLGRAAMIGLVASTLIVFLIPKSYTATAELMPPDQQSTSGIAMMAAMAAKAGGGLSGASSGGGLAGVAGDLLGMKNTGALFIGVLRSETSQDRIVEQFDLKKIYHTGLTTDARKILDARTTILEDRKSGIISIGVTDQNPQRAAAIANAYVDELNSLVASLSTSAAHRERVFLEERLKLVKVDLDNAVNALGQFSSKNDTLDIQSEGKAMLEAAGTVAGELIAAQSELEGLRQIYTDNNPRVQSLSARVAALRKQLEKLGGQPESSVHGTDPVTGRTVVPPSEKAGDMPFPTIRNLPLLGAQYADYYRNAKIQETVFELLTEQYELAKVEEAKETPSVKVLDPGRVPEKKSFPPRLLMIFLGTFLMVASAVIWTLGTKKWEDAGPNDPRKVLAQEVVATLKASAPWGSRNGDATSSGPQRIWNRLSGRRAPTNGDSESEHTL